MKKILKYSKGFQQPINFLLNNIIRPISALSPAQSDQGILYGPILAPKLLVLNENLFSDPFAAFIKD